MSENNINEEQHHYKNSSELSSEDINSTNSIILNDYQPFIIGDYFFVIGTTQNESLYFECRQKDKYYKLLISKSNLCIINEKFNLCQDIDEIYKSILNTINEINITPIHNKLKFTLSVNFDETPYPFEIILKEETNKNALLLTDNKIKSDNILKYKENNLKNKELVLIEENDETSELKKGKSSSVNEEEESQEPSNKNEFYLVKYKINNNKQIKDAIKNLSGKEEENEDEEDEEDKEGEDIEGPSETTNNQNETNKIYNIINELKKDIKNLKIIIKKYEKTNNNEKINELELKNDDLLKEIDKIKKELKVVSEENKKNKEEINILTKNFPNMKSTKEIKELDNNKLENNIKEVKDRELSKSQLITTISNNETNQNIKNLKTIKLKKKKKIKPKSQRKSIIFNNITDGDNLYGINEFIFKQKYKIKETDSELDLTNKKLGDKGLEELSLIKFTELKTLSLDTNKIFSIKPLTNLTLNHLEVLNLDNNYISDISFLEYCKFPSLQILWLNNNNIIDISVLEKAKFNMLQHLYLNNNNITDISVFKKVNFNNLERLYLKNNKIESISCIVDFDMKKLQLVYLNKNKIDFNLSINKEIISKLQKKIKYLSY